MNAGEDSSIGHQRSHSPLQFTVSLDYISTYLDWLLHTCFYFLTVFNFKCCTAALWPRQLLFLDQKMWSMSQRWWKPGKEGLLRHGVCVIEKAGKIPHQPPPWATSSPPLAPRGAGRSGLFWMCRRRIVSFSRVCLAGRLLKLPHSPPAHIPLQKMRAWQERPP